MATVIAKNNLGEVTKVILKERLEVILDMPAMLADVSAARHDKVNKAEGKTMDDLCKDVAEILKHDFGCKILKQEDPCRIGPDGNHIVTEGEPSPNKDSLSLYYYIRYDIAQSDAFADDNFDFTGVYAVVDCDFIVRVTDHTFNESGLVDTRSIDLANLKKLNEQEGSEPEFTELSRSDITIPDTVRREYNKGLVEIRSAIKEAIKEWRISVNNYLKGHIK